MSAKLCISVIEARNILADAVAEPAFYVRLKLGNTTVKTEVVKGPSPKFLKDVRLDIPNPESDILKIEMLQASNTGDLVIGTDSLRVLQLSGKGTVVHWFQLKAFDVTTTAELCLVMRFLPVGHDRPVSPSYAMATREAKQRAQDAGQDAKAASGSTFLDSQPVTPQRSEGRPFPGSPLMFSGGAAASSRSGSASVASTSAAQQPVSRFARVPAGDSLRVRLVRGVRAAVSRIPLTLVLLSGVLTGGMLYLMKPSSKFDEGLQNDMLCSVSSCLDKTRDPWYNKRMRQRSIGSGF